MQKCRQCKCEKGITEFPRDARSSSGRSTLCKSCHGVRNATWRAKNPEKFKASGKSYYERNRDRVAAYGKEYRANNRDQIDARNKDWRQRNPDKVAAYHETSKTKPENIARKKAYDKRFAKDSGYYAKWRDEHREQIAAAGRAYRAANPERVRANAKVSKFKRRCRLANVRCDLTARQWEEIKAAYRHRCVYCGEKTKLTQDHVIPVSKGGEHTAQNIVPACIGCNVRKRNKPAPSFQPHLVGMATTEANISK